MPKTRPDIECPWCDTAESLTEIVGLEVRLFECSCCAKHCGVDRAGRIHKVEPRTDSVLDVNGVQIYES